MITIEIPDWHPTSLNKLLVHWTIAAKRKKKDKNTIISYSYGLDKAVVKRRVHLTISLEKGKRGCDPDAYFKSTLDALVHAGMLVDDSSEWCELAPVRFLRGDKKTIIQLEDII